MKNIIKIFAYLLLSISLLLLVFSLNFINKWNKQNNQISKQLDEINDLVKIEKVEDNENTVIKDDSSVQKNTSLNSVDFSELKNKKTYSHGYTIRKKERFSKEAYSLCSRWCFFLDFGGMDCFR